MHRLAVKIATYILIFLAVSSTAIMAVKAASDPLAMATAAFVAWALSPYACLAWAAALAATRASAIAVFLLTLLAGVLGIWSITDAMFIHPDAQGGLVFIFAPALQWALLALAALPFHFLNRSKTD